jgi:hypothetical protein
MPSRLTNLLKTQNNNKKLFLARDYGTNQSLVVYENFIPPKEPSTYLTDATSCVKMCDTTIGADKLADISSYQTLSADKKKKSQEAITKLVKNGGAYVCH